MNPETIYSSIRELLPIAHPFTMDLFMNKTASLFTDRPDAPAAEKDFWQTAMLWGAWKGQRKDLAEKYFGGLFDATHLEAWAELSSVSPDGRPEDVSDSILQEVFSFDKMIEAELKKALPALPEKKLSTELENAPRFYMYVYAELNVGDDIFAHILFTRYPDVVFCMPYSDSYRALFEKYPNVLPVLYGENIWAAGYENEIDYDQYQGYIVIGGSVFPDFLVYKSFMDTRIASTFIEQGKKVFWMGCNADRNYQNPAWNIDTYNAFFAKYPGKVDICLRDQYSYEMFKASSCARKEPDIVFGLVNQFFPEKNFPERTGLGISLIETRTRENLKKHHDTYMNGLVSLIDEATVRGIPVTIFPFCKNEGDNEAAAELMSLLTGSQKDNVRCHYYKGDLRELLTDFASMKYIVATRFHAVILGLKFRQQLFPVIYGDKTQSLLSDFGGYEDDAVYDLRKDDHWDTENVWKSFEIDRSNGEKLLRWEEAAGRHFLKLDEYLNSL